MKYNIILKLFISSLRDKTRREHLSWIDSDIHRSIYRLRLFVLVSRSELRVGAPAARPPLTLSVEVAAVQQVAVRGPDVPVQRCVLCFQPRESNWRLVDEQLQPRTSLAVVQDEQQVGGVWDNLTGPEASTCETRKSLNPETLKCSVKGSG